MNPFPMPNVTPAAQPIGGGGGTSQLAAALMGHGGGIQLPSLGASIPLSSLENMMLMQHGQGGSSGTGLASGIGNLLSGYQWDGMSWPMLNGQSAQAAANAASMPNGPFTDPYGSMGGAQGTGPV